MTQPSIDRETVWAQILEIYAVPGVQPACLFLQDRFRVDITLLLFSLALGRCRLQPLDRSEIVEADRLIAHWRVTVVQPLRGVRKALKDRVEPVPPGQSASIREAIKRAEQSAEEIEFDVLAEHHANRSVLLDEHGWAAPAIETVVAYFAGNTVSSTAAERAEAVSAIAYAAELTRTQGRG